MLNKSIRWHRSQGISPIMRSMLPFGLFVCLSVTFVRCAQTTRFLLHMTAPCLSQIVFKIWRTSVYQFIPKFCPKVPTPLVIWASATFDRKIAAEWLEIMVKHHRSFEWYHRWPLRSPPKGGSAMSLLCQLWPLFHFYYVFVTSIMWSINPKRCHLICDGKAVTNNRGGNT